MVADPADPGGHVQLAAVVFHTFGGLEIPHIPSLEAQRLQRGNKSGMGGGGALDRQFAQHLINRHVLGDGHQGFFRHNFRFCILSLPDQLPDGVQMGQGIGIDAVVERGGPESAVVEGVTVLHGAAEAHGGHVAVAQGQGAAPVYSRGAVPKFGHRIVSFREKTWFAWSHYITHA